MTTGDVTIDATGLTCQAFVCLSYPYPFVGGNSITMTAADDLNGEFTNIFNMISFSVSGINGYVVLLRGEYIDATRTSMNLGAVQSIDTTILAEVPEPGLGVCLAVGCLALAFVRGRVQGRHAGSRASPGLATRRFVHDPWVMTTPSPLSKKKIEVLGHQMAYHERGEGDPIVLLHGNPTSSYLWRNIVPHLESLGRCIVPDLIGMGDSQKLADPGPGSYRFVEHRQFLDALLEKLDVSQNVTWVIHDWGSALGFDWANRHRASVRAIAYMEAIVAPIPSWDEWPKAAQPVFQGFRSEKGEEMVLEQNLFIEGMLPGSIIRKLSDEEMNEYRRPFASGGEDRRPTLTWPREIPIEGEPADVVEIVREYGAWLSSSDVPKLLINAEPGAILRKSALEFCRAWPNQEETTVAGIHFIQEDSPDEIGQAIADWLSRIP